MLIRLILTPRVTGIEFLAVVSIFDQFALNQYSLTLTVAVFRIRIHFFRIRIQIRIQRLRLETNTDPDPYPIRIQGFYDQKLKKNYS
jgi:hypothetical protein